MCGACAEENMLERIEIEPHTNARCAVIWLHGLGADGYDFEPLVQQWGLSDELGARFILPHAPVQPVTLNGGMRMRAWYDIYDLQFNSEEDAAGVEQARNHLLTLIEQQHQRGISSQNILLAGFSQGGAVALHTALRYEQPLAGVLVLSAYLPLRQRLADEKCAEPARLCIRMDHGLQDPVVPYTAAQHSVELLQNEGFKVDFHSYTMAHGLCPEQIDSLRAWLSRRLAVAI
jgi:phospholipase/carboxylesterase